MANAPATCGAAIDVPAKVANPPPGTDEVIHWPGASNERNEALLENDDTVSTVAPKDPSPVDPTLMALEIQAGAEIWLVKPSFPDAITVAIFAALRASIIGFNGKAEGSLSQNV